MLFCPLFSGSSGNASFLEADGARLLIDAGLTGKAIEDALCKIHIAPESLSAILITHEHNDHVSAAGVLSRRYDIPIYANAGTWAGMLPLVGETKPSNMRVFETDRDFYIKDVNVMPFKTPHDANESVGYVFIHGGVKLSVMTDIGHVDEPLLAAVDGADLLLIEANHDVDLLKAGTYPYHLKQRILSHTGHLSNEKAGQSLARLYARGLRRAILGHLSRENNFEELALETVRCMLRSEDIPDEAFDVSIAHRDRIGGIYRIE